MGGGIVQKKMRWHRSFRAACPSLPSFNLALHLRSGRDPLTDLCFTLKTYRDFLHNSRHIQKSLIINPERENVSIATVEANQVPGHTIAVSHLVCVYLDGRGAFS